MVSASEASAGVFVLRYEAMDLNVCVVRGEGALLVVDTGSSPADAAEIEADLRQLGSAPRFGPGSALDVPI